MNDAFGPIAEPPTPRRRVKGIALALGGVLVGAALAGTITAAASSAPSTTSTPTADSPTSTAPETSTDDETTDESQPQRSDEELLTGDLLSQVTDAALAEYPDATIMRVETDSDGVYEAHLTTADGEDVTVEVGADFSVTGVEANTGHGGHHG
jgi:hypothetical protein